MTGARMEGCVTENDINKQPSALQLQLPPPLLPLPTSSLRKIITVASIAAGVSFCWALQLSLLTPYVQLLGIPHIWAAFMWLCGPISGMIVQPVVGYYSDRCTSRFGRRRPFIAAGTALITVSIFFIGFAADLGHRLGDPITKKSTKPRAITVFILGFWVLDVANNMVQGPCRAFLADLSANNRRRMRTANVLFTLFMAVGNILGYAAGSYNNLHNLFPFTLTHACDVYCANLKSCFFLAISLLLAVTILTLTTVSEEPFSEPTKPANTGKGPVPFFGEIFGALRALPRPMWMLLLVTCLNWIGFFPFLLFDTDWMGREVYGGKVGEGKLYDAGVRAGSLGLMLSSVVLAISSLAVEFLARGGGKRLWGCMNFLLALFLAMTVLVTKMAESTRRFTAADGGGTTPLPPPASVKASALVLFSVMGIPVSATSIVPYAMASIYSSSAGAGQGLSIGVLNLAVVIPQMLVSILSGPWDALFGGGNLPAFVVGAIAAVVSGVLALTVLPSPPTDSQPPAKAPPRVTTDLH